MPTLSEKYILCMSKMLLKFDFNILSESHFILLEEEIRYSIITELLIKQPLKYTVP